MQSSVNPTKRPSESPYNRAVIGESLWTMMLELMGRKTEARHRRRHAANRGV